MRKYNIPLKDVKEVKQEIVECSSGGEGVKEYYYKTNITNNADRSIYAEIFGIINNVNFIISVEDSYNKNYAELSSFMQVLGVFIDEGIPHIYGFKYIDTEVLVFGQIDNINSYYTVKSGNLESRMREFAKINGIPNTEIDSLITAMNKFFIEIAKEEYESMITYKP